MVFSGNLNHQTIAFVTFGLTLSTMYFVYALVILIILMIALINIQPYKKTGSNYPPADLMFLFLLSLIYIALFRREQSSLEIYQYFHTIWIAASIAVGFVPITYTCFLIGLWLFSRRKWIICKNGPLHRDFSVSSLRSFMSSHSIFGQLKV